MPLILNFNNNNTGLQKPGMSAQIRHVWLFAHFLVTIYDIQVCKLY